MKKLLPYLVFVVAVFLIYHFLFSNTRSEGMHQATPDLSISAPELYAEFRQDESAANERFLNKTITIQGEIMEITKGKNGMPKLKLFSKGTTFGVQCTLDAESKHRRQEFHLGEVVSFKCICSDYYNDVELTNCVEE